MSYSNPQNVDPGVFVKVCQVPIQLRVICHSRNGGVVPVFWSRFDKHREHPRACQTICQPTWFFHGNHQCLLHLHLVVDFLA